MPDKFHYMPDKFHLMPEPTTTKPEIHIACQGLLNERSFSIMRTCLCCKLGVRVRRSCSEKGRVALVSHEVVKKEEKLHED